MISVMKKSVILQIPEEVEFQCNAAFALLSSSRRLPSVVLPDMLSDPASLPSLKFPRVSIPLGLLLSLDGRCDQYHTVTLHK